MKYKTIIDLIALTNIFDSYENVKQLLINSFSEYIFE